MVKCDLALRGQSRLFQVLDILEPNVNDFVTMNTNHRFQVTVFCNLIGSLFKMPDDISRTTLYVKFITGFLRTIERLEL